MLISLSGTPGTGKTTVAKILSMTGFKVISMNRIAEGFLDERDQQRDSHVVDMEALVEAMKTGRLSILEENETHTIIEGHLSHHLPVDFTIVFRTSPAVLEKRLYSRGYHTEKVRENMEAEALGVISVEAMERGVPVYEIDTTHTSPQEVAERFRDIVAMLENETKPEKIKGLKPQEIIDYTEEIMGWY